MLFVLYYLQLLINISNIRHEDFAFLNKFEYKSVPYKNQLKFYHIILNDAA